MDLINWIAKHRVRTEDEFEEEYARCGRIRWLDDLRRLKSLSYHILMLNSG